MRLFYEPEDGPAREWAFEPAKLLTPEAEAIEEVGGPAWDSWVEFGQKLLKGNLRAHRAAVWVMLRRDQPGLKFRDFVVGASEIRLAFDEEELAALRRAVDEDPDLDPEQRDFIGTALAVDNALAEVPKDSLEDSPTDAADTASPSP